MPVLLLFFCSHLIDKMVIWRLLIGPLTVLLCSHGWSCINRLFIQWLGELHHVFLLNKLWHHLVISHCISTIIWLSWFMWGSLNWTLGPWGVVSLSISEQGDPDIKIISHDTLQCQYSRLVNYGGKNLKVMGPK